MCCLISRTSFPHFSLRSLPLRYVLPSCYHHLHLACRLFPTLQVEALDSGRLDTLFRGNTIACKVLSISFKTFGLYYLQSVLRPLILSLMKSNDRDYEVDPTRISDSSNLKTNQSNLLSLVSSFYKTILKSLPSLPLQLRTLCHVLYQVRHSLNLLLQFIYFSLSQVVVDRFPDGGLDTVNSAIFLRFINPAIGMFNSAVRFCRIRVSTDLLTGDIILYWQQCCIKFLCDRIVEIL